MRWSQRDNFVAVPTDCPQRDERLGWTGDAQVFAATAAFNYDVRNFLRKHAGRSRVDLSEDVLLEVAQVRLELHDVLEAQRQALSDCLGRLQRSSRQLLERCYAGKDSIKQIAADLGLRPNALYMTLKRLRKTLFDCINLRVTTEMS